MRQFPVTSGPCHGPYVTIQISYNWYQFCQKLYNYFQNVYHFCEKWYHFPEICPLFQKPVPLFQKLVPLFQKLVHFSKNLYHFSENLYHLSQKLLAFWQTGTSYIIFVLSPTGHGTNTRQAAQMTNNQNVVTNNLGLSRWSNVAGCKRTQKIEPFQIWLREYRPTNVCYTPGKFAQRIHGLSLLTENHREGQI